MQHARTQRRKPVEAKSWSPTTVAGRASSVEADVLAQPKPADPSGGPGHNFSKLRVLPESPAAQPGSAVLQALPDLGAALVAGDRLQLAEGEQGQGDVETVTTALGRAKTALDIGKAAAEKAALNRSRAGQEQSASQLRQLAERFGQGAEKLGEGKEIIEKVEDKRKLLVEIDDLVTAVQELNSIDDLRADPQRSLHAFDQIFAAAGTLALRLPDGPWRAYFEFLTHFRDEGGFFENVARGLQPHVPEEEQSPVTEEPQPWRPPEKAPKNLTLPEVGPDVHQQIESARRVASLPRSVDSLLSQFEAACTKLADLVDQYNKLSRLHWLDRRQLAEQIRTTAQEASTTLRMLRGELTLWLPVDFPRDVDRPDLEPDQQVIDAYLKFGE